MKLSEHYRKEMAFHGPEIKDALPHIVGSILNDVEALGDLDSDYEVWLDVELETLGGLLEAIQQHERRPGRQAEIERLRLRLQVAFLVEDAWLNQIHRHIEDEHEDAVSRHWPETGPEYDSMDPEARVR